MEASEITTLCGGCKWLLEHKENQTVALANPFGGGEEIPKATKRYCDRCGQKKTCRNYYVFDASERRRKMEERVKAFHESWNSRC